MPKISVIIVTYNRGHLLARAVNSVLNQTFQDFEILIVDDASTDNTREVVKTFRDRRIVYRRQEANGGEASARNVGLQDATGKYIAFLDSDDEALPTRLEQQSNVLDEHQHADIVYTDMFRITSRGEKQLFRSPHFTQDDILYPSSLGYTMKNIGIGTCMMRSSVPRKVGTFDTDLDYCVDLEYFMRASKTCRFAHIQQPLVNYYEADPDFSKVARIAAARKQILSKHYNEVKEDTRLLGLHLFYIGNDLCYSGKIAEGRTFLRDSLRSDPLRIPYVCAFAGSYLGGRLYRTMVDFKNWAGKIAASVPQR